METCSDGRMKGPWDTEGHVTRIAVSHHEVMWSQKEVNGCYLKEQNLPPKAPGSMFAGKQ